jgi:hypothetical protein
MNYYQTANLDTRFSLLSVPRLLLLYLYRHESNKLNYYYIAPTTLVNSDDDRSTLDSDYDAAYTSHVSTSQIVQRFFSHSKFKETEENGYFDVREIQSNEILCSKSEYREAVTA